MGMTAAARPAGARRWPAGLAWGLTLLGLAATARLDQLLRQAGLPELALPTGGNLVLVMAGVSAAMVGALLAGLRPRHRVGWLLVGLGLSIALFSFLFAYTRYGLLVRPGALPAADYLAGLSSGLVILHLSVAGFALLLTPTGRLPSPRWRRWARVMAAATVVGLAAATLSPRPLYPEYPDIGSPIGVAALWDGPLGPSSRSAPCSS